MKTIDLRSDTLTRPTPAMRLAMADAVVGDDVFAEDPTVNELEAQAAQKLGKEAGLFVASGTMGNLVSLLAHCGRGDEIIVGHESHIFYYEQGGASALGGIVLRQLLNLPDGRIDLDDMHEAIRGDNVHFPRTRLIALENTHNRCGGPVLTPEYTQAVADLAHQHGLVLHVDGARLFNAAVALDIPAADLVRDADSVTFCLSKALAAPVGSVICGSKTFIAQARRMRKVVGGGMRQAGVLAAAGLVALNQMVERLSEDHANARRLAEGLRILPGIEIDPASVQSNIVVMHLRHADLTPDELVRRLAAGGVKILASGGDRLRAVTHYEVSASDVEEALDVFARVLETV